MTKEDYFIYKKVIRLLLVIDILMHLVALVLSSCTNEMKIVKLIYTITIILNVTILYLIAHIANQYR